MVLDSTVYVAVLAAFGLIFMLLWNAIIPVVFNLPPLKYFQAIGILILARLLFGGFHKPWDHHHHWTPLREKWSKMTPEEREVYFRKLRNRYHGCCEPEENTKTEEKTADQ